VAVKNGDWTLREHPDEMCMDAAFRVQTPDFICGELLVRINSGSRERKSEQRESTLEIC
jgi:hypothetical protein